MFQHAPIDPKSSLRLVSVLSSASKDPHRLIECKIKPAKAGAAYTCLSYVWGPPTQMRKILINGEPFAVRHNLWDFLDVASRPGPRHSNVGLKKNEPSGFDFEKATQALWIDALSIDQENLTERNRQVQRMGTIYSTAQRVVAWLGKHNELRDKIQELKRDLAIAKRKPGRMTRTQAARTLCDHEYWQRAWITQETTLAKELYFLAADEAIHHDSIIHGLDLRLRMNTVCDLENSFCRYNGLRKVQGKRDTTLTILDNLEKHHSKQCSDPRDKVYSLLSISRDGHLFTVDYRTSAFRLAKIVTARRGNICLCADKDVETIVNAMKLSQGATRQFKHEPFFELRVSPRKKQTGCDNCNLRIDENVVDKNSTSDSSWVYCLNCSHTRTVRPWHIIVTRTSDPSISFVNLQDGAREQYVAIGMSLERLNHKGNAVFHVSLSRFQMLTQEGQDFYYCTCKEAEHWYHHHVDELPRSRTKLRVEYWVVGGKKAGSRYPRWRVML
jgi:hypothetical protein